MRIVTTWPSYHILVGFWLGGYVFWVQEFQAPTYQQVVKKAFKDYLNDFVKLFYDDFIEFNDFTTQLPKLQHCLDKYYELKISLNLKNVNSLSSQE